MSDLNGARDAAAGDLCSRMAVSESDVAVMNEAWLAAVTIVAAEFLVDDGCVCCSKRRLDVMMELIGILRLCVASGFLLLQMRCVAGWISRMMMEVELLHGELSDIGVGGLKRHGQPLASV